MWTWWYYQAWKQPQLRPEPAWDSRYEPRVAEGGECEVGKNHLRVVALAAWGGVHTDPSYFCPGRHLVKPDHGQNCSKACTGLSAQSDRLYRML